jgi:hypothetical protein
MTETVNYKFIIKEARGKRNSALLESCGYISFLLLHPLFILASVAAEDLVVWPVFFLTRY